MGFSQFLSIFVPILVIFLFTNPTSSEAQSTQELIDKICRQMQDYGFCNNVFHQNMQSPITDFVGLTAIALDQTIKSASNTYDYIVNLVISTTDPAVKDAYMACESAFDMLKSFFQAGLQDFNNKDYAGMIQDERAAPTTQANCEARLSTPPTPNPLADRNRQMRILIAMSLATGNELLH